jgi:tetratricopeptide (TPR) repeat protein
MQQKVSFLSRRSASAIAVILAILAMVLLLAISIWPFGQQVPTYSFGQVTDEQEERVLHLELGLMYEQSGLPSEAQNEYEQAFGTQNDDITVAAKERLRRVLVQQQNPWLRLQSSSRTFLLWIAENGIKLLVACVAAFLAWRLTSCMLRSTGYLILPFQDYAGSKLGMSMARLMHSTVQNARLIHLRGEAGIFALSENLGIPNFGVLDEGLSARTKALTVIDSFKVGSIDLPLGQLGLAIQQWMSLRGHILGGNIFRFGSRLLLEAGVYNTRSKCTDHVWRAQGTVVDGVDVSEQIADLSSDLAYQIIYDLCSHLEANSWRSFRLFTEALGEMQQYQAEKSDLDVLANAARKLEEVISVDPGYLLAKHNLGIIYNSLGDYAQAVSMFREVKTADGWLKLEATYNLGVAYYHQFQDWAYDQAIQQFQEVSEQLTGRKARRSHRRLLALVHCGFANVHARQVGRKGVCVQELSDWVRKHCKEAMSLAHEDREIEASIHVALGISLFNRNILEEAISEFEMAIRLKPNYPISYVYLGESYLGLEEPLTAIQWLERVIRFRPQYEYAHYRLGNAYRRQNEGNLAVEAYKKAPSIPDAHNDLGKLWAENQQYGEALDGFRKAIELNSRLAEAYSNLAWYTIEAGLRDDRSLDAAMEAARRALQLNEGTRHQWHSHDVLGWVCYHCGDLDRAQKELRSAIQEGPKRAQSRYHLALVYQAKGENDLARQTLTELFSETEEKGVWRDRAEQLMNELRSATS